MGTAMSIPCTVLPRRDGRACCGPPGWPRESRQQLLAAGDMSLAECWTQLHLPGPLAETRPGAAASHHEKLALTQNDAQFVGRVVIPERDAQRLLRERLAIQFGAGNAAADPPRILDRDLVAG